MRTLRAMILGRRYEIAFVPRDSLRDALSPFPGGGYASPHRGDCDPPDKPGKMIRVREDLPPIEELEVTLHEALHAAMWHLDESWVNQAGLDLARLLWGLGWRKTEAPE